MTDPIAPADPDVVLRAQNVDLVRDGKLILDRISVTVRAGEHWALLGPNGAGKSTLLNIMATYAHPTRGQMDILGHRLGRVNVFSLRPWIGHISPNHRVEPARTVRQVVLTGVTGTIELPQYWVPGAAEASRAEDADRPDGPEGPGRRALADAVPGRARPDADRAGADGRAPAAAARRAGRRP